VLTWCATALVASAVLAITGVLAGRSEAGASPTPYLTFTVAPTHNLVDGEQMTVTVDRTAAGTAAGVEILRVEPGWCAYGTNLPTGVPSSTYGPGIGFPTGLGPTVVCTTNTHPLNGDPQPVSTISPQQRPTGNYTSVTGETFAQSTGGTTVTNGTLVCDATTRCTFALAVYVQLNTTQVSTHEIFFLQTPVTYEPTSVEAACGGASAGQLSTVGPDRLGGYLTTITKSACQDHVGGGRALADVLTSGKSDAEALCSFASGRADLAYSAIGYGTAKSPFNPAHCTAATGGPNPDRPYVAVPIALDSVDVAHTQTVVVANASNSDSFTDYSQLKLTDLEAAKLIGVDGMGFWSFSYGIGIVQKNPTLKRDFFYSPTRPVNHNNLVAGVDGPVVTSGTQATTYYATSFFHTLEPSALTSPTTGNATLGAVANFATGAPRYAVDPVTGLINIVHALTPTRAFGGMPFALISGSDSAAVWFGMTDAALQAPSSIGGKAVFVVPTTGTLQAAVGSMTPESDGTLVPNPHAPAGATAAYPLTFVEYAIAPTQPLEGDGCTPRASSQSDLADWLNFLVGPAQKELPAGLAPLTPSLEAQAQAAIAKVGTAAGPCGSPGTKTRLSGPGTPTAPGSGGSVFGGSGNGFGGAPGSGAGGSGHPGSGASSKGSGAGATGTGEPSLSAELARVKLHAGSSWLLPAAGVLFLFGLIPGFALFASGRLTRQTFSEFAGMLTRVRRRRAAGP